LGASARNLLVAGFFFADSKFDAIDVSHAITDAHNWYQETKADF